MTTEEVQQNLAPGGGLRGCMGRLHGLIVSGGNKELSIETKWYHDNTFTDQTFIDNWFPTNGSRRMVRVGVRVRFRVRVRS